MATKQRSFNDATPRTWVVRGERIVTFVHRGPCSWEAGGASLLQSAKGLSDCYGFGPLGLGLSGLGCDLGFGLMFDSRKIFSFCKTNSATRENLLQIWGKCLTLLNSVRHFPENDAFFSPFPFPFSFPLGLQISLVKDLFQFLLNPGCCIHHRYDYGAIILLGLGFQEQDQEWFC
ncbi:hypothetical protein V6Z12_D07G149000 [Gossypium hirsutum]